MFKKNFYLLVLVLIVFFGSFLRLYKLGSNPPALFSDEVDAGYQALVFNDRQSDYYGNKFPFHFHSDSDWRTPFIIYSIAVSQKFFGVNEFSTRFPSAFYGIVSIIAFYFLVDILVKNKKTAVLAAFLLSVSPWHIHYSRCAFEVSGMLLFIILGLYFLFKFLRKENFFELIFSLFYFCISIYFYSTAKLYIFLVFLLVFCFYYQIFLKLPLKKIAISFLFLLLFLTPFLIDTLNKKSGYRFSYISIFADPTVSKEIDLNRQVDAVHKNGFKIGLKTSFDSKVFHNKFFSWESKFVNNYLSSFSTDFLFLRGDNNLRHGFLTFGYFNHLDFLFIILGLWCLFAQKKYSQKEMFLLFLLFLATPISFALTNDSLGPHGTRLILMLPFLLFFSSVGFSYILDFFKEKYLRFSISLVFFVGYLFLFFNFYHHYFYHYPQKSAQDWHAGMKEAVLESYRLNYEKIFYSNKYEPFLPFFLYWSKFLPENNKSISSQIVWQNMPGFTGREINSKYFFGFLEWNQFFQNQNDINKTLFVIPKIEEETVKNELSNFNKNNSQGLTINVIREINPQYEMAQKFIIFNIHQ